MAATLQRLAIADGQRLLDVGCGTGRLLAAIADKHRDASLSGVDLSAAMLEIARRRLAKRHGGQLVQAVAESLPFADRTFDVVVSTSVWHFIRAPSAALAEIRRVLAPGGRLLISDWCGDYLTCRALDCYLRAFDRGHFRTYRSAELRAMLAAGSWCEIGLERYRLDWFWGFMSVAARRC